MRGTIYMRKCRRALYTVVVVIFTVSSYHPLRDMASAHTNRLYAIIET